MAKRRLIQKRNKKIKEHYAKLRANRKYSLDYIYQLLEAKWFLSRNTLEKIIYEK